MSKPIYVVNKNKIKGAIDDIQGGVNIFKDGGIVAAEVSQLEISTNMNAVISGDKVILTAIGGGGGASYFHEITWDGSGPYTYTVDAAAHGLGATKELTVSVFENDQVVGVDVSINSSGQVVITSTVNFSNASILISK
jgi:hypothetical protein